ncbi:MAG: phage tail protein I [Fusobacteriaceae bacterium]
MDKENIQSLLPENLKKYKNLNDISVVFSERVEKDISKKIEFLKIYSKMNDLSDKVLNQLAWQWNVEFYTPDLSKYKKIEMIKKSYFHHIKKGTVGALESALKAVVSNLEVIEWYKYGGIPYTFQLIVEGEMLTEEQISTVYKLVEIYRNVRSHLDGFIIAKSDNHLFYFVAAEHNYKKISNKFIG